VLARFDHVASRLINLNHGIVWAIANFRVINCVADRVWITIPKPAEWQHIGNQIGSAMIFARSDFINVEACLRES